VTTLVAPGLDRRPAGRESRSGTFTGTRAVLRLAIRRDRVKLPVWLLALTTYHLVGARGVLSLYPHESDRVKLAVSSAASSVAVVFNGLVSGTSPGAAVMSQTLLPVALGAAFMNVLLVVRHTRQNEETGRQELLAAGVLGRRASLAAAMLLALAADLVLAILNMLALVSAGLPAGSSVLAALAISTCGFVFAAIAAVAAQISEGARTAAASAAVLLGVSFLLRSAGDTTGHRIARGTSIVPAWPTRVSPLGWVELTRPFDADQWLWMAPGLLAAVALAVLAFALEDRRDVGAGLFPSRPGPPRAGVRLSTPVGLAWRLQRASVLGWLAGLLVTAAATGASASQADDLIGSSKGSEQTIRDLAGGGSASLADAYVGATLAFIGVAVAAFGLLTVLRLHTEESEGRAEAVLATGVSRTRWATATVLVAAVSMVAVLALCGAVAGAAWALTSDVGPGEVGRITAAALAQAPVALAVAALGVLAFGVAARAAVSVSWGLFAACVVLGPLGALLGLPDLLADLSPFTHAPAAPAAAAHALPETVLGLVAVLLTGLGILAFRRRDLETH
jgi:ABC-2 type transport system permease protein